MDSSWAVVYLKCGYPEGRCQEKWMELETAPLYRSAKKTQKHE